MTKEEVIQIAQRVYDSPIWTPAQVARLMQFVSEIEAANKEKYATLCANADRYRGDYFANLIRST